MDPKEKAQAIRQKWDPVSKRLVSITCCEITPPDIANIDGGRGDTLYSVYIDGGSAFTTYSNYVDGNNK